jgi:hypothetical protein
MLSEIALLENEITEYLTEEEKASNDYETRRSAKGSFQLPSIVNLESRCKTIFQKADHIEQILMDIITHFYPEHGLTKQSHFPKFHEVLKQIYREEDGFAEFVSTTVYFMRVIRELRNALDHRLPSVRVRGFELQKDGNILSPTIELNDKDVKLERADLGEFLKITNKNLIEITETTFAFLAGRNVNSKGMPYQLREIPKDQRRYKFVRYSFWMPLGDEGFYHQ